MKTLYRIKNLFAPKLNQIQIEKLQQEVKNAEKEAYNELIKEDTQRIVERTIKLLESCKK